MHTDTYDPDDPYSPLVTVSVLNTPISTWTRPDGREVHLLVGPLTLILLPEQAAEVVTVLQAVGG